MPGLFDLTELFSVRERYGVRLTDGGSDFANDSVGLSVMRTSVSQMSVMELSIELTVTDSIFNGEDFTRGQVVYTSPVPVPAAVWLFVSGMAGLLSVSRRKKY